MNQQDIIDALKEMSNLKEQMMPNFMQGLSEILSHKEQEPNPIALGIQYAPKIVSNINLHLNKNPLLNREDLFKSAILPIRHTLAFMDFYEQELLEKGFDLDYCRSYFTTLVEGVENLIIFNLQLYLPYKTYYYCSKVDKNLVYFHSTE